jgi:hypothetical protein
MGNQSRRNACGRILQWVGRDALEEAMAGRLQDKVALVVGAGSVGPGWGNGKEQQRSSPAKEQRWCAPTSAQCPMGHMGDAWDVAYACLCLASDEAKYVTGIELVVNGGITLKCA